MSIAVIDEGKRTLITFAINPGYCDSTQRENFNTPTPVFEIDGDFVTLIFAATMWGSINEY
jgi:hypothetical protein